MTLELSLFTYSLLFSLSLLLINTIHHRINNIFNKIRNAAIPDYRGNVFFELLSILLNNRIQPKQQINYSKILDKPSLILMNHTEVTDPLFILKATKRRTVFVATDMFNWIPGVKRLLDSQQTIYVKNIKKPKGFNEQYYKANIDELNHSNLSPKQISTIVEYNNVRKKAANDVISNIVDNLKSGRDVVIFPSGGFDHYKYLPHYDRTIKSGAAKAVLQAIEQKVDANVVVMKKTGIPSFLGGSLILSIPYMLFGGSKNITISTEAVIPLSILNKPSLIESKDPVTTITALLASYMSTEYLHSPNMKITLPVNPIELTQQQYITVEQLRQELSDQQLASNSVRTPLLVSGYSGNKQELTINSLFDSPYLKPKSVT